MKIIYKAALSNTQLLFNNVSDIHSYIFQTQQHMNPYLFLIHFERVFLLKVGATAENFTWNSMYVLFLPIFETKLVKGFVRCSFQIEIKILWSV